MTRKKIDTQKVLDKELINIISETNGINLNDTLDLLSCSPQIQKYKTLSKKVLEFREREKKQSSFSLDSLKIF